MFGFIRPYKPELRVREVNRFQAVYCGLCHEIKDRYGRLQTYFLSYDMTFLLWSLVPSQRKNRKRDIAVAMPAHFVKKRLPVPLRR